jgi:hypothetical protein
MLTEAMPRERKSPADALAPVQMHSAGMVQKREVEMTPPGQTAAIIADAVVRASA